MPTWVQVVLMFIILVVEIIAIVVFGAVGVVSVSDEVSRQRVCEMVKPEVLVKPCEGEK